jgi:hypothetical protein
MSLLYGESMSAARFKRASAGAAVHLTGGVLYSAACLCLAAAGLASGRFVEPAVLLAGVVAYILVQHLSQGMNGTVASHDAPVLAWERPDHPLESL